MVLIVAYDLVRPHDESKDYQRVIDGIKAAFPTWAHVEQSVWIVESDLDAEDARDELIPYLRGKDRLFVAQLADWASYNATPRRARWLKKRAF